MSLDLVAIAYKVFCAVQITTASRETTDQVRSEVPAGASRAIAPITPWPAVDLGARPLANVD